jgi:hypothetical protein
MEFASIVPPDYRGDPGVIELVLTLLVLSSRGLDVSDTALRV